MSLTVVLTPEAQDDYSDAVAWYQSQTAGAGDTFAAQVQDVFDRLAATPLLHAKVRGDVRKAVVRRAPYVVLYIPETSRVVVVSVFHTSRDPSVWQGRVPPNPS